MNAWRSLKTLALIFLAIVASHSARGQVMPFDHYSLKDGLPSNWITVIYQDSRGYLWVGGDGGLAVYDGISFKAFGSEEGLPVGHVWEITESRKSPGTMYIGTHGGGLSILKDGKISSIPLGDNLITNVVSHILEDRRGVIWCGTGRGVYRVENNVASFFQTGADTGGVGVVRETRDGNIIMSVGRGQYRHFPETGETTRLELNADPEAFICMSEDDDGTTWFGTIGGMIHQVKNDRVVASRKTPYGELQSVLDDHEGNLWFASDSCLIKVQKKAPADGEIILYAKANGLPDSDFNACLADREGNLWFGSRHAGLIKISERHVYAFQLNHLQPGLLNRASAADSSGHLFVVSGEGLGEIWKDRNGNWRKFLHRLLDFPLLNTEGSPAQRLVSVDIADDGTIWVAARSGGLLAYKTTARKFQPSSLKQIHRLQPEIDLPKGTVVGMMIDRNRRLWYSIWGGALVRVDLRTLKPIVFDLDSKSFDGTTQTVCQVATGDLWISPFNDGIYIFQSEGSKFRLRRRLTSADGLASNQIRSIIQRRNGEIWIGTRFDGISILKNGKFQRITMKDGLLNNAVWAMAEDDEGRMWIGTSAGMQHTAPDDARKFFTPKDLFGKQIGSVGVIAGEKIVWGASSGELTIYEYGTPRFSGAPPLIYITNLLVNGKERGLADGAKYAYDENLCAIRFHGISFKSAKSLQYKYRLIGLDDRWQEPTDQRVVTYASLPPGEYTFEVSAVNSDGVESATPASLSFSIQPPFWRRWWFIFLMIILASAILYGVYVVRVERLLAIEKIRSRIATDLHDEIGAGLTHIGLLTEMALQKSKAAPNHDLGYSVERVGMIARELTAAMSDVVWSINPKHDSVDALQRRLKVFAHEICNAKEIELRFEVSKQIADKRLNPEIRRNILLIVKEALHNMAKYSASPSVAVRLDANGKSMIVEIEDQGKGFDLSKTGSGNGLANMKMRAEKIGGSCEIISAAGKGTKVIAVVPCVI